MPEPSCLIEIDTFVRNRTTVVEEQGAVMTDQVINISEIGEGISNPKPGFQTSQLYENYVYINS
jgi:hypothetical protein